MWAWHVCQAGLKPKKEARQEACGGPFCVGPWALMGLSLATGIACWPSLTRSYYVVRVINKKAEVPRFDYSKFLEFIPIRMVWLCSRKWQRNYWRLDWCDMANIFRSYAEKMATRERRKSRRIKP